MAVDVFRPVPGPDGVARQHDPPVGLLDAEPNGFVEPDVRAEDPVVHGDGLEQVQRKPIPRIAIDAGQPVLDLGNGVPGPEVARRALGPHDRGIAFERLAEIVQPMGVIRLEDIVAPVQFGKFPGTEDPGNRRPWHGAPGASRARPIKHQNFSRQLRDPAFCRERVGNGGDGRSVAIEDVPAVVGGRQVAPADRHVLLAGLRQIVGRSRRIETELLTEPAEAVADIAHHIGCGGGPLERGVHDHEPRGGLPEHVLPGFDPAARVPDPDPHGPRRHPPLGAIFDIRSRRAAQCEAIDRVAHRHGCRAGPRRVLVEPGLDNGQPHGLHPDDVQASRHGQLHFHPAIGATPGPMGIGKQHPLPVVGGFRTQRDHVAAMTLGRLRFDQCVHPGNLNGSPARRSSGDQLPQHHPAAPKQIPVHRAEVDVAIRDRADPGPASAARVGEFRDPGGREILVVAGHVPADHLPQFGAGADGRSQAQLVVDQPEVIDALPEEVALDVGRVVDEVVGMLRWAEIQRPLGVHRDDPAGNVADRFAGLRVTRSQPGACIVVGKNMEHALTGSANRGLGADTVAGRRRVTRGPDQQGAHEA